ncbi:fimbrial protein [Burkholderia sp. Ax-1719]|uniref:fimbrial protein n=1 Tax=Burkholderia sp. Ax-1719 TaxID=2608334 RepID=UPI0014201629|nr:fimbrial protein [Burkholderia sp. Ax-1719]NIE64482.1 type 1 fimbrial protein [Burkholderia sp. Ax-1719]
MKSAWHRSILLLLSFVVALSALFGAPKAHAGTISCDVTSLSSYTPVIGANSFGRDAPIGSTTASYPTSFSFNCPGDPCCDRDIFVAFAPQPSTLISGYKNVYQTNVPGIGVQYTITNGAGTSCNGLPLAVSKTSTQVTCHQLVAAASPGYNYMLTVAVQFIKTGAISPGALTTIPALSVTNYINNQSGTYPWGNLYSGSASGSFSSIACSVKQSAIQVTLPQARTKDLGSVGATTGATPFALALDCDPGVNVAVTLTDASNPANRSTTLGAAPGSTAGGVALQIVNGATAVAYGPDSAVAGNVNQWSAGRTAGGAYDVPLSAQYVRTSAALTPGTINGVATFTMSYQ